MLALEAALAWQVALVVHDSLQGGQNVQDAQEVQEVLVEASV